MKDHNIYDFHSVYLKTQLRGTENWERIEGVQDADARLAQLPLLLPVKIKKPKNKIMAKVSRTTGIIPGAVRHIVRFFK